MIEQLTIMALLTFLVVITIAIIVLSDLVAAVILSGVFSLVAALAFVVMDAVDVAFTEAAVGAGISTILLLGALKFTVKEQKPQTGNNSPAIMLVVMLGALLIYGTLDMPHYGDGNSPAYTHEEIVQHYIHKSYDDMHIPNIVTSVLASYRGYDTLGETVVVFTAAIGVLSILGLRRRKANKSNQNQTDKEEE